MRLRFGLVVAGFASTLAVGGRARAQSPSEIAVAQGWFNEGLALEGAGKWKEALERFRRVAAVKRTPQVDFHVGLGESHTGELVLALVDLGRALETARAQHVANVESAASAELEAVRARVPRLQLEIPRGATVQRATLDGRALATVALGEPIAVDPGPHTVTVSFPSGDATQKVTVEERALAKVVVEVPADAKPSVVAPPTPPAPAPASPAADPAHPSSPPSGSRSTIGWVLVGAGGAALVGGVVFWAMRGSEISALDDACGADRQHCPDSARSHYDAGKTDTVVSALLFGAGVAAAGVGLVLLVGGSPGASKSEARITPLLGPGTGGAAFSTRF